MLFLEILVRTLSLLVLESTRAQSFHPAQLARAPSRADFSSTIPRYIHHAHVGGLSMVILIFVIGKRVTDLSIRLFNSLLLTSIAAAFVGWVYFDMNVILSGNYFTLFFGGGLCLMLMTMTYFLTFKSAKK